MAAATADRDAERSDGIIKSYKVKGSTTIYKDTMVSISGGYLVPASDTSGYYLVGVAIEKGDNSSGSNGDVEVRVVKTGEFKFNTSGASQADVGKLVYVVDDQTVSTSDPGNSVKAGYIQEFIDSSTVRVRIDRVVQ